MDAISPTKNFGQKERLTQRIILIDLDTLANKIQEAVAPVMPPEHSRCVLLDFPSYANVGDSAIWLGTLKFLQSKNLRLSYVSDLETFDEQHLRSVLEPDTTIILQGGGNLGDLWAAPSAVQRESDILFSRA